MRRSRVLRIALVVAAVVVACLWSVRVPVLTAAGALLVEEGAPGAADALVLFSHRPVAAAVEAAGLYRAGHARRVVVLVPPPDPDDRVLARLGIPATPIEQRAALVLTRSGVPRDAIVTEPGGDGTNAGVRATARWAERAGATRLIVVADRSHTRRIATLLRARLPRADVVVRTPRDDPFDPTRWWHDRGMAREAVMEALRWANSVLFGDLWAGRQAAAPTPRAQSSSCRSSAACPSAVALAAMPWRYTGTVSTAKATSIASATRAQRRRRRVKGR